MHNVKDIITDPQGFVDAMRIRGVEFNAELFLGIENRMRTAQFRMESIRAERNRIASQIGILSRGDDVSQIEALKAESNQLSSQEHHAEMEYQKAKANLKAIIDSLPNLADVSVPEGGEESNTVVKEWGDEFRHTRHHADAATSISSELAHKLGNGRLSVLRGGAARLSRALTQFMLDNHTRYHGYEEINAPVLVHNAALYGTGQLPKFEDDLFTTSGGYLAPTAEVMLTNLVAGDLITTPEEFPMRFVAQSQCFRLEAGSAGRDTRGILRQNQFEKVELVSIVLPVNAEDELERMTWCAEQILEQLGLPYRRVLLAAQDMGFSARKTYDLEVWMAGEGVFREISSCSWCGDFQARRMNTRVKIGKEKVFPHTLNGSALAVGRTLAALIEYYLHPTNGHVYVPEVLQDYLRVSYIEV